MVARALKAAAELAGEGQQDTRTYAKRAVFALAALAKATEAGGLERLLSRMPGRAAVQYLALPACPPLQVHVFWLSPL